MNSAIALALISLFPFANFATLPSQLRSQADYGIAANLANPAKLVATQAAIISDPELTELDNLEASDPELITPIESVATIDTTDAASDPRFAQIMQMAIAQNLHQKPIGEIVQTIAEQLEGSAYKEGLLDRSPQEQLVISLSQFDCVLLVETVLALARGVAVQDYAYATLAQNVESLRYANGELNGYCSRLHYFSGWINDNQKRGQVIEIGDRLGGIPLNKPLRFMSNNWQLYPKLLASKDNLNCIVAMEKGIDTKQIAYVPTEKIRSIYSQLQPGDIIAIATEIEGLDVTHTGLAYRHSDGSFGLIHASPVGRVVVSADLQAYIARQPQAIGILVARPVDPRSSQI
jgi:hypothetical protein